MPAAPARTAGRRVRLRLDITGAVQGVGFRPFIYRLAIETGLGGFVCNTGTGASLEIEGSEAAVATMLDRIRDEIAPPAGIVERKSTEVSPLGESTFVIEPSVPGASRTARVLPDLVTCEDCLADIGDPGNRRYLYPFTTCTRCGPRFSIVASLPFDRERTAMRLFPMCAACRAEYDDPASRRYHAETISCPACGPRLTIAGGDAEGHAALLAAVEALRRGQIVALKGLGGFQLLADAGNAEAVARLRLRKCRPAKPFAVMVASLTDARRLGELTAADEAALTSPAGPIVLARARASSGIAAGVAPANPRLGLMLPTTPLHHLLLRGLGVPVVATSGNRGEEPIIAEADEAQRRIASIADLFLVHDRPILRPVDDSVVHCVAGRESVLRLARGLAPLNLDSPVTLPDGLALGAEQKDAIAFARDRAIVLFPHIGDLGGVETRTALRLSVEQARSLHGIDPQWIAADAHPGYFSGHLADELGPPVRRVPHHVAHVLAGMLDNGLEGDVLGVAWDGTGYGADGTIWGGEFLSVGRESIRRVAHLLPFRLPGGDAAAREPRRSALGALHAIHGGEAVHHTDAFEPEEARILATMLERGLNSPVTSSVGRLFDAVASILGLCQVVSFEAEAAMAVEFAAERSRQAIALPPIELIGDDPVQLDWRVMLRAMLDARTRGETADDLAAAFHRALVEAMVAVARRAGISRILLTGGCFQNRHLVEMALHALGAAGFEGYTHHRIPPNDGGIAAGQIAFVARMSSEETA